MTVRLLREMDRERGREIKRERERGGERRGREGVVVRQVNES
jgi:hypothetical protein